MSGLWPVRDLGGPHNSCKLRRKYSLPLAGLLVPLELQRAWLRVSFTLTEPTLPLSSSSFDLRLTPSRDPTASFELISPD
ncbi:uncharacterized protein QC764_0102890 [Podospora pseudoanserina]|uniref:Uncharacterized protein n=1 Tax=Podospora pseudoanserina TaxID=2609844 RepID=A0ABR0HKA0_9PEZI|nr:hypothetical protein QC764_0102890 [Podospora pseudoanserina]